MRVPAAVPERFQEIESSDDATIDALIRQRIEQARQTLGGSFKPVLVKTEANYARLSASSRDVLYEASFHLQPGYYTHTATGADTSRHRVSADQPIMYYTGSARTPLALPVISNLAQALSGGEALYTINLGLLPLPVPGSADSIRYYVIIERALESTRNGDIKRFERFHKEFTAKADEPIPLRLANEPLAKGMYIVKLENSQVLDFYEDFSRFIDEHIILSSERLKFGLGKQTISDVSSRLSIPFSIAQTCVAKVELLSVVDTANPMVILDTIRQPADYLAEMDMSHFADGPYRYRFSARELGTNKEIFSETHSFQKATPVTMVSSSRILPSDTIEVGGKKKDWAAYVRELNGELTAERVTKDRLTASLGASEDAKHQLESIVKANAKSTIADVHGRVGVGVGTVAGDHIMIGIEANKPAISFDVTFGYLYASAPYLSYVAPTIFSQITSSPKSLGVQLTWIPVKFFDGIIEPLVSLGYYGIWSQPAFAGGLGSATLLSGQIGVASEPLGEVHGLGFSLSYGASSGLGLNQAAVMDLTFKTYVRF